MSLSLLTEQAGISYGLTLVVTATHTHTDTHTRFLKGTDKLIYLNEYKALGLYDGGASLSLLSLFFFGKKYFLTHPMQLMAGFELAVSFPLDHRSTCDIQHDVGISVTCFRENIFKNVNICLRTF